MQSQRFYLWLDLFDDIDKAGLQFSDSWHPLKGRLVANSAWDAMVEIHRRANIFDGLEIP